eukprot:TRINITY_DN1732_c0_g1_i1.p1 TRINITY_DN1732_c0_g1~~TRINITY_DN1732_c0_g1_i1.p1  ORF type:complete len:304 (+),score=26.53 TRINITY_DN1732_c0_g1_i1:133-1044(+)
MSTGFKTTFDIAEKDQDENEVVIHEQTVDVVKEALCTRAYFETFCTATFFFTSLGLLALLVTICQTTEAFPERMCFLTVETSRIWIASRTSNALLTIGNAKSNVNITFYGNKSSDGLALGVDQLEVTTSISGRGVLSQCYATVDDTFSISQIRLRNVTYYLNWINSSLFLTLFYNNATYVINETITTIASNNNKRSDVKRDYGATINKKYLQNSTSSNETSISPRKLCNHARDYLTQICQRNRVITDSDFRWSLCSRMYLLPTPIVRFMVNHCNEVINRIQMGICPLETYFFKLDVCRYSLLM